MFQKLRLILCIISVLAFSSFKAQAQIVNIAKLGEQENEGFGLRLETKSKLTSGNSHVESYAGHENWHRASSRHGGLILAHELHTRRRT